MSKEPIRIYFFVFCCLKKMGIMNGVLFANDGISTSAKSLFSNETGTKVACPTKKGGGYEGVRVIF